MPKSTKFTQLVKCSKEKHEEIFLKTGIKNRPVEMPWKKNKETFKFPFQIFASTFL